MEKETTKAKRYRYYLHRKVKLFADVNARGKQITIDKEIKSLPQKRQQYIKTLATLGYNIQLNLNFLKHATDTY